MIGKILITSTGYDPQAGKSVKDPYLGNGPSFGACRPDIRRAVKIGDHIFFVSGQVPNVSQFVMGGFEVAEKIHANEAYLRFPEQRLRLREDGQLEGNVIVGPDGKQHQLDQHNLGNQKLFENRLENYVVGRNEIIIETPSEIALARSQTLEMLRQIFGRSDGTMHKLVGHYGRTLSDEQVICLREWLLAVKKAAGANSFS